MKSCVKKSLNTYMQYYERNHERKRWAKPLTPIEVDKSMEKGDFTIKFNSSKGFCYTPKSFFSFLQLLRANSVYAYHSTRGFEPGRLLEQRNTSNSRCPSRRISMVLVKAFQSQERDYHNRTMAQNRFRTMKISFPKKIN